MGTLFSSDAWNNITFIAGEVKYPRRNIPLSLAAGTALVTLLYVLANVAYLCLLPLHKFSMPLMTAWRRQRSRWSSAARARHHGSGDHDLNVRLQ